MVEQSIVFTGEIDDRSVDQSVEEVDERLQELGDIQVSADTSGMGGPDSMAGGVSDQSMMELNEGIGGMQGTLQDRLPGTVRSIRGGAAMPIAIAGGVGIGLLSAMTSASARLQTSASMLSQAWDALWRPLGDDLDKLFVRPVVEDLLDEFIDFEQTWNQEGRVKALAEILTGLEIDEDSLGRRITGAIGGGAGLFAGIKGGAAAGGAAGATLGSIIPGAGTAAGGSAGAIVGAILGGIGGTRLGSELAQGLLDLFPEFSWPSLPEPPELPELPEFDVPEMPDIPDFPGWPEIPSLSIADINQQIGWPDIDVGDVTGNIGWPTIQTGPLLNEVTWPTISASDITDSLTWPIIFGYDILESIEWPNINVRSLLSRIRWPNISVGQYLDMPDWPNIGPGNIVDSISWPSISPGAVVDKIEWPDLGGGEFSLGGSAQGSVINRPTPLMAGESGTEIITPIAEFRRMMESVAQQSGGGGGNVNIDMTGVESKLDRLHRDIKQLNRAINNMEIRVGEQQFGELATNSAENSVYDTDPLA